MQFICKFQYHSVLSWQNTSVNFSLVDGSKLKMFRSFFIIKAWLFLLEYYPGALRLWVVILFRHDVLIKCKRPKSTFYLSIYLQHSLTLGKLTTNEETIWLPDISLKSYNLHHLHIPH